MIFHFSIQKEFSQFWSLPVSSHQSEVETGSCENEKISSIGSFTKQTSKQAILKNGKIQTLFLYINEGVFIKHQ